MTDNERDRFEIEYIDRYGIASVLDAIAEICYLKAEHIRLHWQPPLGSEEYPKLWDSWGRQIDNLRANNKTNMEFLTGRR